MYCVDLPFEASNMQQFFFLDDSDYKLFKETYDFFSIV